MTCYPRVHRALLLLMIFASTVQGDTDKSRDSAKCFKFNTAKEELNIACESHQWIIVDDVRFSQHEKCGDTDPGKASLKEYVKRLCQGKHQCNLHEVAITRYGVKTSKELDLHPTVYLFFSVHFECMKIQESEEDDIQVFNVSSADLSSTPLKRTYKNDFIFAVHGDGQTTSSFSCLMKGTKMYEIKMLHLDLHNNKTERNEWLYLRSGDHNNGTFIPTANGKIYSSGDSIIKRTSFEDFNVTIQVSLRTGVIWLKVKVTGNVTIDCSHGSPSTSTTKEEKVETVTGTKGITTTEIDSPNSRLAVKHTAKKGIGQTSTRKASTTTESTRDSDNDHTIVIGIVSSIAVVLAVALVVVVCRKRKIQRHQRESLRQQQAPGRGEEDEYAHVDESAVVNQCSGTRLPSVKFLNTPSPRLPQRHTDKQASASEHYSEVEVSYEPVTPSQTSPTKPLVSPDFSGGILTLAVPTPPAPAAAVGGNVYSSPSAPNNSENYSTLRLAGQDTPEAACDTPYSVSADYSHLSAGDKEQTVISNIYDG
ncbi:uncharacterized protein LOC101854508 [Aplysia californica]|uniref:Uncharacterized protein LOC101854508 n=1 Tax=Aplysia californica TaxID=6500 RepID=A0ABM0JTQ3_APLCA|nr:uncharacterized protein LOC101854508 [Aplysia californica]